MCAVSTRSAASSARVRTGLQPEEDTETDDDNDEDDDDNEADEAAGDAEPTKSLTMAHN